MTEELPLVSTLKNSVIAWRDKKYEGASKVTKRLLNFWFNEDHLREDDTKFEFWRCQREAIETLVYAYEICGYDNLVKLVQGMNINLFFNPSQYRWNKYAFKMATGSGKTFVMAITIVWQFFNKLYKTNNGRRYTANFLMIAPNLIVLDRLKDAFEDGKIFSEFPFIPEEYGPDFDFQLISQNEDVKSHSRCILHLTNWQQFVEHEDRGKENPVGALLGKKPVKGEEFLSRKSLLETLCNYEDLVILNDEAHHVYTDELVWGEFISKINEKLKEKFKKELIMQLDFSATPQYPGDKRMYFPHIIYDYPLKEAIEDRIVKRPIIGIIEGAPEPISKDFVEKNKLQIDTGLKELDEFKKEYGTVKKPVLFIMCDNVKSADKVGRYIGGMKKFRDKVLVIHTDKDGNVTKTQLPELRRAAMEIDTNQYDVIVSVMMLKEGWDVKNVSCIVPLRAYTSQILVEQTLGRGLRRMFPDVQKEFLEETLVVIEHPRFRQLWESEIREANLDIEIRSAKTAYEAPNKISVDKSKLKYDFQIPIVLGGLTRNLPDLAKLDIKKLQRKQFQFDKIRVPKIMYRKKELLTQKIIKEEELSFDYTDKHFEYLSYIARAILAKLGFTSQFADLVPLVRNYIENYLFDKKVDIEKAETVKKLNDPRVRIKLRDSFVDILNEISKTEEDLTIKKYYKLSDTPTIHTTEKVYKTQKTVFDYLPYPSRSHYEKDFMIYLDGQKEVLAYTKVLPRFPIRIPYYDQDGFIRYYIPDFIVKTKKGFFVIETKGTGFEEMVTSQLKEKAAKGWCEKVSKLTKEKWEYVKIVEDEFRQYSGYSLMELIKSL